MLPARREVVVIGGDDYCGCPPQAPTYTDGHLSEVAAVSEAAKRDKSATPPR